MDVVQTWEDVQQISVAHGRVLVVAAYGWSSHSQRFLAAIGNAEESFIVQRVRLAFFQLEDFEHAWRVCPPVALAWLDGYLEPSFFLFDEGRCSRIRLGAVSPDNLLAWLPAGNELTAARALLFADTAPETENLHVSEETSDTLEINGYARLVFPHMIERLFDVDQAIHDITATVLRWSRWAATKNVWFNESNLFRQVGATPFDCSGGVWGASFQGLHSVDDCVSRLEPTMRRLLDFRMLDLRGTDVTDRALKLLLETGLRILYLNGTAVTEAGKNELASALPSLHIEWGTLQNWQCIRK